MGALMTDSKKRRMSMLDSLAAAGAPTVSTTMMSNNRALRSARDAVDSHRVWELDPADIDDTRYADRLDPADVADLRASIEANGQTVPILVRRHPSDADRYLLVYGRRRLEAIRGSAQVEKVRALIASLDDSAALKAQISENTGRRDLSYIERALFAQELLDSGYGNQAQIAEVLNVTKSAVSMAISLARAIGPELAMAIGPAHGVGRPRWDALAKDLGELEIHDSSQFVKLATETRAKALDGVVLEDETPADDPSAQAFETVARHVKRLLPKAPVASPTAKVLRVAGKAAGRVQKTAKGVRLDLLAADPAFAAWLEDQAESVLEELHERWKQNS